MITGYDYRHLPQSAPVSKHKEMRSDQFRFQGNYPPTHPSPNSTLTFASHLGQNVGLGEGYVGSFEAQVDSFIQVTVFCPP